MKYMMVMVAVESESGDWPTRKDVANDLDPVVAGQFGGKGYVIEGVKTVQLDVDTLTSLVEDANLTGEQTVELMGQITAHSIGKSLVEMGKKLIAEGAAVDADA